MTEHGRAHVDTPDFKVMTFCFSSFKVEDCNFKGRKIIITERPHVPGIKNF